MSPTWISGQRLFRGILGLDLQASTNVMFVHIKWLDKMFFIPYLGCIRKKYLRQLQLLKDVLKDDVHMWYVCMKMSLLNCVLLI